jgi:hypothetical protein
MSQLPPLNIADVPKIGSSPRMDDVTITTASGPRACPPACVVAIDTNLLELLCQRTAQYVIAAYIDLQKQAVTPPTADVEPTKSAVEETPAS